MARGQNNKAPHWNSSSEHGKPLEDRISTLYHGGQLIDGETSFQEVLNGVPQLALYSRDSLRRAAKGFAARFGVTLVMAGRKTAGGEAEAEAAPVAAPAAGVGPLLGVQQPTAVGGVTVGPPPPVLQPVPLVTVTPKSTYATPFKQAAAMDPPAADEPEVPMDADCDEDIDKVVGIRFNPINYQCITEDENYVRTLLIILHLPNGIQGLELHPSGDGLKLLIRGSAPTIFSEVGHMAEAEMTMNRFESKAMEDALMVLRRPKSRSVRIYGEVDLLEPSDPVEPEKLQGYIDPHTAAAVMIVRLKCVKSKQHNLKKSSICWTVNKI